MKWLGVLVAVGVVALIGAALVPVSRSSSTCVVCRLTRLDANALGLTRATDYGNECSRWYAAHVEPSHEHVWEPGGCVSKGSLLGRSRSVSRGFDDATVWALDPSTQEEFYRHFARPLEAKAIFISLLDGKACIEGDENRGRLTVRAIKEWQAAGFPGTWAGWWSRFEANQADESKERSEWEGSKSPLSFEEWRERERRAKGR